jgi:pSer/pThr/pTyr-binding forkhead associated (FHA) protein
MARVTLVVLDGADRGRVFESLATPVTIGREEGNSVQLNDDRVSRFHLKIQEDHDQFVLTDLESTNGTKVNGEDIQLRILRHGDVISVGRSVLRYGSKEEILASQRRATLRDDDVSSAIGARGESVAEGEPALDVGSAGRLGDEEDLQRTAYMEPPELPQRLGPAQAAQLAELIEYLHIRIRYLIASVRMDQDEERVTLDRQQWQNLVDLQACLAGYLRAIGEPGSEE